eukprot:CAMPEP_0183714990 /NCGR_PEP_ID=MMETSP0737-20130205/9373_1 /TAXON_ID=385413 /ORGANISM="Thalassiosira miniscula, Strain CCMP1093" /LENGTH=483 /DNA_ID=CAMNT_0025944035 /DNA_START=124 /DNA_END=1575 /DNA_ORIENTATION=-
MDMRRRQGQCASDASSGIFLIESLAERTSGNRKEKHYRRHRGKNRSCISLLTIFLLAVSAISVALLLRPLNQLHSNAERSDSGNSRTATSHTREPEQSAPKERLSAASGGDGDGGGGEVKPESAPIMPISATGDLAGSTTSRVQTSEPPEIPTRLIFSYKYNLLDPTENDPPYNRKDPITKNVINTVELYSVHWHERHDREVVVSFLSENNCLEAIKKAQPRLVSHFRNEAKGEYRDDICRFAELYLYGGFSFAVDIKVVEPVIFSGLYLPPADPDPIGHLESIRRREANIPSKDDFTTFATIYDRRGEFTQTYAPSFVAATPRHPVLKRSLDYMVDFYEGTLEGKLEESLIHDIKFINDGVVPSRSDQSVISVGPFTLSMAISSTTDEEWELYARKLANDHGYTIGNGIKPSRLPAKIKYARYIYDVSLEDEDIKKLGLFLGYNLGEDTWCEGCNHICFEGHQVFFYSKVPGLKGNPLDKDK